MKRLYIEGPSGEKFEKEVPGDMTLGVLAADFFEERNWPTSGAGGRARAVVELVNPDDPDDTKRQDPQKTIEQAGLRDGDTLRIFPEIFPEAMGKMGKWKLYIEGLSGEKFVTEVPGDLSAGQLGAGGWVRVTKDYTELPSPAERSYGLPWGPTRRLVVEEPSGEKFEADVTGEITLGVLAAYFFEARSWPTSGTWVRARAVVELVNPDDPDDTKRLNFQDTVEQATRDGDTLRIFPEPLAGGPVVPLSLDDALKLLGTVPLSLDDALKLLGDVEPSDIYRLKQHRRDDSSALVPASRSSGPPARPARRFSNVSFPERVCVGKATVLKVGIGLNQHHDHDVALDVAMPLNGPAVVTVSVAAENFRIDSEPLATISVLPEGDSRPVVFLLTGEQPGPGRVMVDFFQDGRALGSVDLRPHVTADDPGDVPPARGSGAVSVRPPGGPAPDITLLVHEDGQHPGRLHFYINSPHPQLRRLALMTYGYLGYSHPQSSVLEWVRRRLGELNQPADDPAAPVKLEAVGQKLYSEVLSKELKELCWVLAETGIVPLTMMILSDEPHVPWEMIQPHRLNPQTKKFEQLPFWGESFALARWLRGSPLADRWEVGQVYATVAGQELDAAGVSAERSLVDRLEAAGRNVRQLVAQVTEVERAFNEGTFDLYHLSSHGKDGGWRAGDESQVLLDDGPFKAGHLRPRMQEWCQQVAPLVVFNCCETGKLGYSLTQLGSWAGELVRLGCGGFIGTQWVITTPGALVFAETLYKLLIQAPAGERELVAEAVRLARLEVRKQYPRDPTWLAYSCFADPLAGVTDAPPGGGLAPAVRS